MPSSEDMLLHFLHMFGSIWENKCEVTNTAAVLTYCKDVVTSDNLQGIPMYTKNYVVQRLAICRCISLRTRPKSSSSHGLAATSKLLTLFWTVAC